MTGIITDKRCRWEASADIWHAPQTVVHCSVAYIELKTDADPATSVGVSVLDVIRMNDRVTTVGYPLCYQSSDN